MSKNSLVFPDRPIILHVHSMLHDAQFILHSTPSSHYPIFSKRCWFIPPLPSRWWNPGPQLQTVSSRTSIPSLQSSARRPWSPVGRASDLGSIGPWKLYLSSYDLKHDLTTWQALQQWNLLACHYLANLLFLINLCIYIWYFWVRFPTQT